MREDYEPEEVERALLRDAWRHSRVGRETQFIYIGAIGYAMLVGLLSTIIPVLDPQSITYRQFTVRQAPVIAIGWMLAFVICYLAYSFTRSRRARFYDQYLIEKYGKLGAEEAKLLEEEKLGLAALWRITEERLRLYHEIATRQAQASFRNAQYAIGAGFIVIIAGACGIYFSKNATIAVVLGALGTAGAALSAYIGKTFLRLQENAATHLRSYFDQPREQFRYLAAERMLAHIKNDERKADTVDKIIQGMTSPDYPAQDKEKRG